MTNHCDAPARRFLKRAAAALAVSICAAGPPLEAQQPPPRFLAKEQIVLYGIGLKAEPARQVVPRDIATIVSTFLQAPTLPDGVHGFAPDAEVRATLRGPSFSGPQELIVRPNTPFQIPPLTVAGVHTLEDIRLVSGGDVLLRAIPESVVIEVIDKLLVTQVTARALTAAEIREKGIVFDRSNFQAYNFTAAFAIEDRQVNVEFPVLLPQVQGAQDVTVSTAAVPDLLPPSFPSLQTIIPDTLKLQAQIPNLSVVGFTLKVPALDGQDLLVPPIPGVIVIPGDIGFLNQFFSVMLMVGNVAPGGSNLVVSDLHAEIVLPPGRDLVVGSGDDPLRMARTAAGASARRKLVVQPGADGRIGTSDDVGTLGPGESGNAEYLVEGVREGSHVVEMEMAGTLHGLPVGPVEIRGRAAGAVLVRNPTFTLTFTHPETVSAGEPYTLDVTVTNTGESPANFVSVNLFPRDVSGATVVGSSTREIESIAPGDSRTVAFDLISRMTGQVTAATLDADDNVGGRFALKTAVGELGGPVSPDSLVLPREAKSLPQGLREAAIGLLGKAWAVATAPRAALPKDTQRFSRKIVMDRATEVAEAGFRVTLHEPLPDSAAHLAMDFIGSKYPWLPQLNPQPDDLAFAQENFRGFDALRRQSVRGDRFADAVAAILAPDLAALGAQTFHARLASTWSYRPEHVSILLAGVGGAPAPYRLSVLDAQGRRVGGAGAAGKVIKEIPFSDALTFVLSGGGTAAEMAVLAVPSADGYTIRLERADGAADGAPYVLSLVQPDGSGGLRQLTFQGTAGAGVPAVPASGDPYQPAIQMFSSGEPETGAALAPAASAVVDPPPTILGAVQQLDADQLRCDAESAPIPAGRVIAVLFSEDVTAASVQDRLNPEDITNYAIDGNRVVGVALQPGRRIAFLALRDPYGPFVQRQLTVSNVMDARGQAMPAASVPIEATMGDDAGVVSGRMLRGDGTPVPFGNVRLFYLLHCEIGEPRWIGISSKPTDAQGRYSWDYVSKRFVNRIVAVDEESGESRDLRFSVARNGQRLNVDVVLLGRGTFRGRALAEDGRPLADTVIRLSSLTDHSQYGATTAADGAFAIGGIPVGSVLVEAVNVEAGAQVFLSEAIPFAGAVISRDLRLLDVNVNNATVHNGRIEGFVYRPDGVTPIAGAPVIAYYQSRSQPNVACPKVGEPPEDVAECAVAFVTSGPGGSFALDKVTSGEVRLYAFDQASLAEGGAYVLLPADSRRTSNILLAGGLGTVTGRVVDPAGAPLAGARVGGGFTLATTNAGGEFTLTDVPVGRRDIVAVSDTLGTSGKVTIDIARAGEVVGVTIVLESVASVAGRVLRADGTTPVSGVKVHVFRQIDTPQGPQIQIFGVATADPSGAYRIDRLPMGAYDISVFNDDFTDGYIGRLVVKVHQQVLRADLEFRGGGGTVRGAVFADDGQTPLAARLGITGDQVVIAGGQVGVRFQQVQNFAIVDTNLTTGEYSFGGLWVGGFTLRAVGQFSPDPIAVAGEIPRENETVELNLRLKPTSQVGGIVYQPDGVTPAGANVVVNFKSEAFKVICATDGFGLETCTNIPQGIQSVNVVTDPNGRFFFPIVNAGAFTLTADDPVSGKVSQVKGTVKAGEAADLSLRLLGLAELTVQVLASDTTTVIPNARVDVEQVAYPRKKRTLIAGPDGVIVFAGGDGFSEGELIITGIDQGTGLTGRASARIAGDGERLSVRVFLANATATVFGTLYRSDGTTPVPNADVVISNADGPLSFGVTGPDGTYRLEQVPLGRIFVESFEATTARRAFASEVLHLASQEVPVMLVQGGLGIVRGTLIQGGTLAALKGWEITLEQTSASGRPLPALKTTTSTDGSWSFPGTSRGSFTLTAAKADVRGGASAIGDIERDGQIVDVPLIVQTLRPLEGRVEGTVFNPDGTRAPNSVVEICYAERCGDSVPPLRVTADASGDYFADGVPLGRFSVTAIAQVTGNVGRRFADMEVDGDVVRVDVAMVGLTVISGTVIRADGTPATSAVVRLEGSPSSGCVDACTQGVRPTDAAFSFVDVPARTFTVSATDAVTGLRGAVGGTVNPGEHNSVTVVLQPTGTVGGRVLRAAGPPAHGIIAELILAPGTSQERRLFRESGPDGTFLFDPSPLGAFTLVLEDPAGPGLAQRTGSVAGGGALGDIVLDEAPPAVASTFPSASASGVARNAAVRVIFTEPILPGTVNAANVVLEGPSGPVGYTLQVGEGDTVATLTPVAPLADETRYAIRVANVRDRVAKLMSTRFTATFTTEDVTAPAFVSVSPAVNGHGIPIFTPVRIQFSEPIDPVRFRGPPLVVTGPAGAVAGRLDYTLGNTVLVFTPNVPLADDAAYRVVMSAAADPAGNTQPQDLDYTFTTTDRTPPQIVALTLEGGTVVENTTATIAAQVGPLHDVAVVDWYINDVFVFASRTAPFVLRFTAIPEYGTPGQHIKVSAIAIDTSGNRASLPVSTHLTVVADQPPVVAIAQPAVGTSARNGDRITVNVAVTDDVGVARIAYKANTGQPQDAAVRAVDPAAAARTESFAFTVPAAAAPGSTIAIEASAVDTKGQSVQAVPVTVTVIDAVNPAVTITGTTTGAKVNPGQTTTAIVSAEDPGGISSVVFTVGGVVSRTETRLVDPAQAAVAASFSIQVPQSAQPGQSLTLDAVAVDRAGNRGTAARVILPIADTVAPTIRLTTSTGSLELVRGQPVTIFADADDEMALSRVELSGQGAFTLSDAKPVSPPLGSARVPFTINVPATLDPGAILTLRAVAVDISGNASLPAMLTLSVRAAADVTLPASAVVIAGESQPVAVQLVEPAPAGGLRVDFTTSNSAIATVTSTVQFGAGETTRQIQVTGVSGGSATLRALIQGVQRASMTVTTRGGIVRGAVFDALFQPVAGVQLTINSVVPATTNSAGEYFAEGVPGTSVSVKAFDPVRRLRGYSTGAMNRAGGFATVNVALVPAGAVRGDVRTVTGDPAGAGARVEIVATHDPGVVLDLTFTDDSSAFEFPLVSQGSYVVHATRIDGRRGLAPVTVSASGDEETVSIAFLGEGSVIGTVRDGAGTPVSRAPVTFRSVSVFGAAPQININAEADGTFRFDRVPIGSFTVQARDDVTGRAGTTSGAIAQNAQTVTADVHLSTYGGITGVVFRPDGVTPAAGALVNVLGHSTVTNDLGEYDFTFLPLGPFTVTVNDQGTRQKGRASGTLTTQGETQTVDITLHPQGSVVATVTDASGNTVEGAVVVLTAAGGGFTDTLSGTTGADGTVAIDRVLAGTFEAVASFGALRGRTSSTAAADEVRRITIALEPTGTIRGVVYEPDGHTPSAGARLSVSSGIQSLTVIAGADGVYRIDGLTLPPSYTITVADAQGIIRARTTTPLTLVFAGHVITNDFIMVGLGTVTGRVINPDSSSAQGLRVSVHSFHNQFGGVRAATTNAGGFYAVANVPVAGFSVSTGDVSRLLLGEGSGAIAAHGATATVDILLVGNAVTPPVVKFDANNYRVDVQQDGSLLSGLGAFRSGGGLRLDVVGGGAATRFQGSGIATIETGAREIAVREQSVAGLSVTRKIFVPRNGYFARYLDAFTNTTAQPITVDVRLTSQVQHTQVTATSSGDAIVDISLAEIADRWAVLDDASDAETGVPATAFVLDGPGAPERLAFAQFDPATRELVLERRGVTVQPNATVAYLYFVAQQTGRAAALASAERLVQLPPEALEGLSGDEIAQVTNFAVPPDGSSVLPALPVLTGVVDGRVLASDASTAIPSTSVFFRSANPLFGRTYAAVTASDGRFVFTSAFDDVGTSRAIPSDAFTLRAQHPVLTALVLSPTVTGTFTEGTTAAAQDVVFSNTGRLRGTVRLNGTSVGGAQVAASGAVGATGFTLSTTSAGDGSYVFALMPEGAATVRATTTLQGTPVSATTAAAVTAGATVQADVTIDTVPPQVTMASPAAGTAIDPRSPLEVSVTATDNGGVAAVAFSATGAVTRAETRGGPAAASRTEVFTVPFESILPTGGSLTLTVTATDVGGNQANASRTLTVLDVVPPAVTAIVPAAGAADVAVTTAVTVQFSEPIDRSTVTATSMRLTGTSAVPVTFAFADNDRLVTMTPAAPLAFGAPHAITVDTGVSDAAGNRVAAAVTSVFTTKAADVVPPRVSAIQPADNAVDVPNGAFIEVTFSEPVDPATITPASFRVSTGGAAIAGAFTVSNGDTVVRFTPSQPLPFGAVVVTELTAAIADPFGNGLVDGAGGPLTQPLTFTFLTASFGITRPARGEDLVELRTVTLEAQGSASLGISTMTFEVNGVALPTVLGPPFAAPFDVPARATAQTVRIVAIARNAGGAEVARDEVTANVVVGLRARPTLLGVPRTGTAFLRLSLSSPIAVDLPIALTTGDAAVVAVPASVVLPAGQMEVAVPIGGTADGSTAITATSSRGDATVIASVSPAAGKTARVDAPIPGLRVLPVPFLGRFVEPVGGRRTVVLSLLETPAPAEIVLSAVSSHEAIARVDGPVTIPAGEQAATFAIVTGTAGTAVLTLRAGGQTWLVSVVVGAPPAGTIGPILAQPVGVRLLPAISLGWLFLPQMETTAVPLVLLSDPAPAPITVTITTGDPGIARVDQEVVVPAGERTAIVPITMGSDSFTTLRFRAGSEVRELRLHVGTPAGENGPLTLASPVGVRLLPAPAVGILFAGTTVQRTIVVPVLPEPAAADTAVAISSSHPNVASVLDTVTIPAGAQSATFTVATGMQGVATLWLDAGGEKRQLVVVVGTPPASAMPLIVAPIVRVEVRQ